MRQHRCQPSRTSLTALLVPSHPTAGPAMLARAAGGGSAQTPLHLRYWYGAPASNPYVNHRCSASSPAARSRDKSCNDIDESRASESWISQGRPGRVGATKQVRCSCRCPFCGSPGSNFGRGSNNSGSMGGLRNGDRLVKARPDGCRVVRTLPSWARASGGPGRAVRTRPTCGPSSGEVQACPGQPGRRWQ